MAIPGLRVELPVKAKVRIGEKKQTQGGKEYPSSVDYFICEDTDFQRVVGKASRITIQLPFDRSELNFSTGLEWWRGKQLTCYSKGEGSPPLAYRVKDMVGDAEVRGEPMGRDRLPITCPVRECEFLKNKSCKPMGRLQFFIEGIDPRLGVFQIDTKSWHSVEEIEGTLAVLGDPRGMPLELTVEMRQVGTSKFPVLNLEAPVVIEDEAGVALAEALVQLDKAVSAYVLGEDDPLRVALAGVLDLTTPGWRERQDVIDRIKEVGVADAARRTLERLL